jgi:uncharacterized protein YndB with AHSA1/START domain
MTPSPSSNPTLEIVNTRVFDAPRAKVFGAFANPTELAQWWGPDGFTNTINQFEFRPGGAWRYVMHGPNGANYVNASDFLEIVPPEKIVLLHLEPMHRFQTTMTYTDVAPGKTQLTWRMQLERTAENERLKEFLFAANEQNFDRLAALLKKQPG